MEVHRFSQLSVVGSRQFAWAGLCCCVERVGTIVPRPG